MIRSIDAPTYRDTYIQSYIRSIDARIDHAYNLIPTGHYVGVQSYKYSLFSSHFATFEKVIGPTIISKANAKIQFFSRLISNRRFIEQINVD